MAVNADAGQVSQFSQVRTTLPAALRYQSGKSFLRISTISTFRAILRHRQGQLRADIALRPARRLSE